MIILAVDPGSTMSGYMFFDTDTYKIVTPTIDNKKIRTNTRGILYLVSTIPAFGKVPNEEILGIIQNAIFDKLILEDIVNQGVNGKSIIQTVRWTGRFDHESLGNYEYISRPFVKKHLTGRVNGIKDSHIRQAVIARLEPSFTRQQPGCLKGVTADVWQATALAIVYSDLVNTIAPFNNPIFKTGGLISGSQHLQ